MTTAIVNRVNGLLNKPTSKTAACRLILEETPDASNSEVVNRVKARWGYDATSSDVSNAKVTIRDARERQKREDGRRAVATEKTFDSVSAMKADLEPDVVEKAVAGVVQEAHAAVYTVCRVYGVGRVRQLLEAIERDAKSVLGQK